ncbi:hypothetical protein [Nocardioides sp. HDW12B]|uniref:hypothetical protein n=1 Tax=Nocardioides sp. HDW12B TaxID=2714939 RepID=UPI001F112B4E|nr:hypothetical protein [Nocardioides sp. HDW12B]
MKPAPASSTSPTRSVQERPGQLWAVNGVRGSSTAAVPVPSEPWAGTASGTACSEATGPS